MSCSEKIEELVKNEHIKFYKKALCWLRDGHFELLENELKEPDELYKNIMEIAKVKQCCNQFELFIKKTFSVHHVTLQRHECKVINHDPLQIEVPIRVNRIEEFGKVRGEINHFCEHTLEEDVKIIYQINEVPKQNK